MEVTSQCGAAGVTEGGAKEEHSQSRCVVHQPTANGNLPHHNSGEAPPTLPDRAEHPVTSGSSTNDVSLLLPTEPASNLCKQKGVDSLSASPPPVCAPPSPSVTSPPPSHSSSCGRHHHHHHHHHHHRGQSTNQKRLSSCRSPASFKSDAAHIKEAAGDDCCAHCLLACLYCHLLSVCSALGECVACGVGGACCGCEAAAACGGCCCVEEACQAVLDCGVMEGCCASSDCLEVGLECCAICFPS